MNLNAQRAWITPAVIGAFLLLAVTGGLMFFHLGSGLNKTAHEWVGWIAVAAVLLHLLVNQAPFKRHLQGRTGRAVVLAFAVALGLSFIPAGASKPAFAVPVQALARAPLPVVAEVAGVSTEELRARLQRNGLAPRDGQQTIADLAGPDLRRQMRALSAVLAPADKAR